MLSSDELAQISGGVLSASALLRLGDGYGGTPGPKRFSFSRPPIPLVDFGSIPHPGAKHLRPRALEA